MRETKSNRTWLRRSILLSAPAVAFIATLIHPRFNQSTDIYSVLAPQVDLWITLHIVQLLIFGLLGLTIYWLIDVAYGLAPTISRIAIAVFIVFYLPFDALAGIATGLLVQYAKTVPPDQLPIVSKAIDAFWQSDVVNNMAAVGAVGWGVAVLAAAVALARPAIHRLPVGIVALGIFVLVGISFALQLDTNAIWWWVGAFILAIIFGFVAAPRLPSALLVLAAIFFSVSHVFPSGTVGMAALFFAIAHLEFITPSAPLTESSVPVATPAS
jgi:hypothetical protein